MDLVAERKTMQAELDKHKSQVLLLKGYIMCLDRQLAEPIEPPKETS